MASSKLCSAAGCGKVSHKQGLCSTHARRLARWGSLAPRRTPMGIPLAWINAHLDHSGDGCLVWPFYRSPRGISGVVKFQGRATKAFVVVCTLAHGDRPTPGHEVAHSCGKGHEGCVHPKHLRWATREENRADMVLHGTSPRGENSKNHKLKAADVREIRRLEGSCTSTVLAARFGVSRPAIKSVWRRRNWAWLD